MNNNNLSRREFVRKSALGIAGVAVNNKLFGEIYSGKVLGANDRVRMGFIGVGNRGSQLMKLFMGERKQCEIAGLCDVYQPYVTRDYSNVSKRYTDVIPGQIPKMGEKFEYAPKTFSDYRKMLEQKDIDAVCIATPDHWHALQTIDALSAGKDIFCEKPLSITLREGRMMIDAQKKTDRIVAVGLNRRGCSVYQKLAKDIPAGKIGKVTVARAFRINNLAPNGIGKLRPETPPADFNWDMWLGPRPMRPYQYNIAPYFFRWHSLYSSQMGNWGVHFMDVIRWMMGEKAPCSISAHGTRTAVDDDSDIPDTMQVVFQFPGGGIATFCIYEASTGGLFPSGEVELRGTKGTLYADEGGYKIIPTKAGNFQKWDREQLCDAEEFSAKMVDLGDGSNANSTQVLVRNFLECVKDRKTPLCTLEEGHRSTSFAHLANIALATGDTLKWDAEKELFINNPKANELLHYEYRSPWKL